MIYDINYIIPGDEPFEPDDLVLLKPNFLQVIGWGCSPRSGPIPATPCAAWTHCRWTTATSR
ncbi:hypothetical protein NQ318_012090 [Aromia moschata]|uniref:Uncharacterized protein n=1 Tax=Aromia moschata TaxID=1265417 RepID=A0AAV8XMU3_9CUCU|nr:hypothetical protein NQ318_012090 [Aromia moschata]